MIVHCILITNADNEQLGSAKIVTTLEQFQSVTTTPGGIPLWPELAELFSCDQPGLKAVAVWHSANNAWLSNIAPDQVAVLYEQTAREQGFW